MLSIFRSLDGREASGPWLLKRQFDALSLEISGSFICSGGFEIL